MNSTALPLHCSQCSKLHVGVLVLHNSKVSIDRHSERAAPRLGQKPFSYNDTESEKKPFLDQPLESDPLQNVMVSSLAYAPALHQVSGK